MKPFRIQLKRTKGWRMPANTVKVTRGPGLKWGNPFVAGEMTSVWHRPGGGGAMYIDRFLVHDAAHAVRLFASALGRDPEWYHEAWTPPPIDELRGKNLACWCALDAPCHADVLLELANG